MDPPPALPICAAAWDAAIAARRRARHDRRIRPARRSAVAFYGDDYTGSSAAMEALTFAGLPTILFLEPPTPERLASAGQFRGIGIAGVARSQGSRTGWSGIFRPSSCARRHRRADRSLQGLLDIRFLAAYRLDRAGDRSGGAASRRPLASAAGRIAGDGPLSGVRASVRDRERHRPPPRPPSDHVAPSGDADGRVRSGPSSRAPDRAKNRARRLRHDGQWRSGSSPGKRARDGAEIISLDVLDQASLVEAGRLIWDHRGNGCSPSARKASSRRWLPIGNRRA